jgi:hypothetical protein
MTNIEKNVEKELSIEHELDRTKANSIGGDLNEIESVERERDEWTKLTKIKAKWQVDWMGE